MARNKPNCGESSLCPFGKGDGGEDESTDEADAGSVVEQGARDGHIVIEVSREPGRSMLAVLSPGRLWLSRLPRFAAC